MKKTITLLLLSFLFQNLVFSQNEETKKDSLTLEEELEQYYYEKMDADFLDTFPEVKEVEQQPEEEKIFKVVEDFPRFPGCEGKSLNKEELKKCAEQEMIKFFYRNIKYPLKARNEKTQGEVIGKFVVDKDGSISKVEILNDIGNGCGEEVRRVLLLMNEGKKWVPPSSRGKPVKVLFTIPFQFKLISLADYENKIKNTERKISSKPSAVFSPIVITAIAPETLEIPKEEKIFKVVENMPRFPGCEGKGLSKRKLKECSDSEMLKFVYSNLKYPQKAIEEKTEGWVVLKFVVAKNGFVKNVKIIRDIGNGCGEEAKRVVLLMNEMSQKWTPSKLGSRGKPINVELTLPVSFRLPSPLEKK